MSQQTRAGNPPCDIALTQSRDFIYTDPNNSVNFVKNNRIQPLIKLWSWRHLNLCSTSSGDLLVIIINDQKKQAKVVQCTYCDPAEKQSIQTDGQGKPLYSSHLSTKYLNEN